MTKSVGTERPFWKGAVRSGSTLCASVIFFFLFGLVFLGTEQNRNLL